MDNKRKAPLTKQKFRLSRANLYLETLEPSYAKGNGWECFVREDGSIECWAVRTYSDGEHSIKYAIQKNGFAKLTLKQPGCPVRVLRKGFVGKKGRPFTDGTIGLAGGNIDQRYAFCRADDFQNWLRSHGIDRVEHADPNGFIPNSGLQGLNFAYRTDGTTVYVSEGEEELAGTLRPYGHYECKGATWLVVETLGERNHVEHRLLRALGNPLELQGVPELG